ncbi:MAG: serpin family protein [Gemmatimonadota bacterium]
MRSPRLNALAALLFVACNGGDGVIDVGSDPRVPDESVRPLLAVELAVAAASNEFGMDLFRQVAAAESDANVLISPLSASLALGMTLNGADGTTYTAMRDALGFAGMTEAEINAAYRGLIPQLAARDDEVEFRLANAIWYRIGFDVEQPFLDAVANSFFARAAAIDFDDPRAPRSISQWAEDQTGGRIKDLVEEIDPNDVMFLINAVYFKAPWATPFVPAATRSEPFTRSSGGSVSVPTMNNDAGYPQLLTPLVQIVELIYADSAFSMVLVAPADGSSLAQLTAGLTPGRWADWMDGLQNGRIMLSLPRFSFDYDVTMNDALMALGMGVAFDEMNANFDRIHHETRNDLYISKVRQKAFIDVHELGTEAAAATSVTVSVTSMPPQVRFDRPFLFAIRERSSGAILFIGRVGDPS